MSRAKGLAWYAAMGAAERAGHRFSTFGLGFIAFGRTVEESQRKHARLMQTRGQS